MCRRRRQRLAGVRAAHAGTRPPPRLAGRRGPRGVARTSVEQAADEAARSASIARTAAGARRAAEVGAAARSPNKTSLHLIDVDVDVGGFAVPWAAGTGPSHRHMRRPARGHRPAGLPRLQDGHRDRREPPRHLPGEVVTRRRADGVGLAVPGRHHRGTARGDRSGRGRRPEGPRARACRRGRARSRASREPDARPSRCRPRRHVAVEPAAAASAAQSYLRQPGWRGPSPSPARAVPCRRGRLPPVFLDIRRNRTRRCHR